MQLGIIGVPMVGKTTIFELLTASEARTHSNNKANVAIARIPDARIDYLADMYHPRKTTYAQMEVVDIPGLAPGADRAAALFLDGARKADALLLVIRVFQDESVPAYDDPGNPVAGIETINYELLLADLDLIDKRIERINESKKKNQMQDELALMQRLRECLEKELPLTSVPLKEKDKEILSSYQFLTTKPMLVVINMAEGDLMQKNYPGQDKVHEYCRQRGLPLIEISAGIEREIAELDGEDRELFMSEIGISEPGLVKISRSIYERLGLISFFTVGEDEVKAWTIEKGTIARKAAGKIHSDIERGFIRAEVVEYDDLKQLGSMASVKDKGLFRLEGKEYLVKDGDIVHFRFNI